jgi:hypothetical protein
LTSWNIHGILFGLNRIRRTGGKSKLTVNHHPLILSILGPIELKVSYPKIHPWNPEKTRYGNFKEENLKLGPGRVAQWIRRLPTEQEILSLIPGTFSYFVENCYRVK